MEQPFLASIDGATPQVADDAFVAPTAVVVGRVWVGARASVWYGSVLRGDDDDIVVGADCNVQDRCVLHADPGEPCVLGERVSLGHGAIVHGARIDDDVLVGMGAVVMNGAHVGSGSLVAAGAVVAPGTRVEPGSLVAGVPGKVRRQVGDAERAMIARTPDSYRRKSALHQAAVHLDPSRTGRT
ncbi:MAG: gamma carbonic anhydrase family protein [Actinomycetota bacterium]|nr:gamma carbonic anhydrase family protein [Actinomycetota bacterium]